MRAFGINQGLIARRLFVQILLLSLMATVIISALQLHFRYRDKLRGIEYEIQRIETSHLNSMAVNLWLTDETLLSTELEGIMDLPNIQFVEVRGNDGQRIALGAPVMANRIEREYPLVFSHRGIETEIGKFRIQANLDRIWPELLADAAVLSLGEAGKIFVVAFLVFILFQISVGRHLRSLALQAKTLDIGRPHSFFNLDRPSREGKSADELEYLVSALNGLNAHLMGTIGNLRQANEKLDHEIGERKRAEDALRQANLVVENSPVVVFRWRAAEGWPVEMVSKNVSQFGYTPEELLSGAVPFLSMVHSEDLDRVGREVQEYAASGTDRFQQEYRVITKNGGVRWVDDRTVVERNTDGQIVFYQGLVIDMTERKRAEDALRESEERFTSFMRYMPGFAFVKDHDRRVLYVNELFETAFGLPLPEWLGKTNDEIWPGEVGDKIRRDDEAVLGSEKATAIIEEVPTFGELRTYRTIKFPIPRLDGRTWLGGMSVDITELKHAEDVLRSSLAERESLLKEVHHRVKNNLQIIISLLNLQDHNVQNPEVHGILRDTQNRVRSMALLHETLYRSGNLAKVSFPQYVKSICAHLARSYASDADRIRLRHDIADVTLDMDQAIPAGLIISELVANAFKHAFLSRSSGEILVEFQTADEHHRVLRVSDNGVGLPAETRPQNAETLGLLLVSNLSRQLDGRMSVISEIGTVFEIVFPVKSI